MTDSGFSSAASQRSTSSIIRPSHINSFSGSLKSNLFSIPSDSEDKENNGNEDATLPKPCIGLPTNCGRPVIPNRLLYGKNHGGYSPGLSPFSNHDMSPMSSLAYDFRDLNTSHNSSATPRKRLSLSSVSSLDSPHPSNSSFMGSVSNLSHVSPAPSSVVSPHPTGPIDDSCFPETPTPTETSQTEIVPSSLKDPKSSSLLTSAGDKPNIFRRNKTMPSAKARFRLLGVQEKLEDTQPGKENAEPCHIRFTRNRSSGPHLASPMGLSDSFSPIGCSKIFTRPSGYNMMSSPLVNAFSHVSSSAFKPVSPNEPTQQRKRRVLGDINLNVPPTVQSPQQKMGGGVKRLLNESASNSSVTVARKRKCSRSLTAKKAFHQDRKTKSADAILSGRPLPTFSSSPISSNTIYRPISAPVLMGEDDDDYVLSHSSLCSQDSDDEEMRRNISGDEIFVAQSISGVCKEDEIENMMCDNIMQNNERKVDESCADVSGCASFSLGAPSGLDGLISGPLLLSSHGQSPFVAEEANDSMAALFSKDSGKSSKNDESLQLKPRELFRSPSAPPLVPSRRALMKLKRQGLPSGQASCDGTPVSIKRPRTFASLSDAEDTKEMEKAQAIPDPSLNRSRSYNDMDIMRAVDQGCEDLTLVGDFSRSCSLPTVPGRKQDLKYITPQTLVDVIDKKHDVGMFEIVDCRYTYEYEGGHVGGAVNVWTEEQLLERFFNREKPMWAAAKQQQCAEKGKPHVLIFHCEFSSERGPRLARSLRNHDRAVNVYPNLHYPEIYVLKDGYKEFYHCMKDHCEPRSYIPMSHEDYASELRKFRIKSKTWAGEKSKHGLCNRLKR